VLLRKHGEADQMHTPGAMPDLRLLPWLVKLAATMHASWSVAQSVSPWLMI